MEPTYAARHPFHNRSYVSTWRNYSHPLAAPLLPLAPSVRDAHRARKEEGHEHQCLRPPRPRNLLGTERIGATSTEEFTVSTRTRRRFDDDEFEPPARMRAVAADDHYDDGITYSTYPDSVHGPAPLPNW